MKKQTKIFEKQFIKARNAIERKGISMAKAALTAQYNAFLERAKTTDFRQWKEIVESTVKEEPIKQFMERYYPMSSTLAVMVRKNMLKGKAETEEDKIYNSIFQTKLTQFLNDTKKESIRKITNTTQEALRKVINDILDEADTQGWGIPEITSNLYKQTKANLIGNGYARARAIAQTEVISASNKASEMAAQSTGYEYKRYWSTSGLPRIRDSHLYAEKYSNEKDGLKPDELFDMGDGTFMKFPGDPNGTPENIINCRCSCLYEIIF